MTTPSSINRQPHEKYPAAFDFTGKGPAGTTLVSAQVHARRAVSTLSTTLNSAATAGDASVSVAGSTSPRKGAKLILEPGTTNEETCVVTAVSGSGPYTCTLLQTVQENHSSGVSVTVFIGASDLLLTTTTAAINSFKATVFHRGGLNSLTYQLSCYATFSDGSILEDDLLVVMTDG